MFSPAWQETLLCGEPTGIHVVSTMHASTGCVGEQVYIVDKTAKRVYVVATAALESWAKSCPLPDTAAFMREVYAQYKAEQSGQVGHA